MSWIFGFYSKNINASKSFSNFHPPALATINSNNFYAAIGGNKSTSHFQQSDKELNYFMCGVLISEEFERVLEKPELDKLFFSAPESIKNLNGHFCGIFYKDNSLNYDSELARIDEYVKAHLPFVQLALVNKLFSIPVNQRKNNRLFKKIIKSNCNSLSRDPLAKGNQLYPYYLNPIMKKGYSLIQNKLSKPTIDRSYDNYLSSFKEFALDAISSQSVKEYSPYNYKLIRDTVLSYYDGEVDKRKFVDWFISFELFRQLLD